MSNFEQLAIRKQLFKRYQQQKSGSQTEKARPYQVDIHSLLKKQNKSPFVNQFLNQSNNETRFRVEAENFISRHTPYQTQQFLNTQHKKIRSQKKINKKQEYMVIEQYVAAKQEYIQNFTLNGNKMSQKDMLDRLNDFGRETDRRQTKEKGNDLQSLKKMMRLVMTKLHQHQKKPQLDTGLASNSSIQEKSKIFYQTALNRIKEQKSQNKERPQTQTSNFCDLLKGRVKDIKDIKKMCHKRNNYFTSWSHQDENKQIYLNSLRDKSNQSVDDEEEYRVASAHFLNLHRIRNVNSKENQNRILSQISKQEERNNQSNNLNSYIYPQKQLLKIAKNNNLQKNFIIRNQTPKENSSRLKSE